MKDSKLERCFNALYKRYFKRRSFILLFFVVLGFNFFFYYKMYFNRIKGEYEQKGVCYELNKKLTLDELYENAVYDDIIKEIKYSNKLISDYERCKDDLCGVYIFSDKCDFDRYRNCVNEFYTNPNNFIKLNDVKISKNTVIQNKIKAIYVKGYYKSGMVSIFMDVKNEIEKNFDLITLNNYYFGMLRTEVDEDGSLGDAYISYIKISACGEVTIPFLD